MAQSSAENSVLGMISIGSGLTKMTNKKNVPIGNAILGLEDDKGNIY